MSVPFTQTRLDWVHLYPCHRFSQCKAQALPDIMSETVNLGYHIQPPHMEEFITFPGSIQCVKSPAHAFYNVEGIKKKKRQNLSSVHKTKTNYKFERPPKSKPTKVQNHKPKDHFLSWEAPRSPPPLLCSPKGPNFAGIGKFWNPPDMLPINSLV